MLAIPSHTSFALFSLLTFSLILRNDALFPKTCVSSENLSSKECCPVPRGLTEKCGGAGKGFCAELQPLVKDPVEGFSGDLDRFQWPTTFFNRSCRCLDNFHGADCSSCKFGWTGQNCDQRKTRTRRNILAMSTEEVDVYISYLLKAKETVSDYMIPTKLYRDMDEGRNPQFNEINMYDLSSWYHYYSARENILNVGPRQADPNSVVLADFAHEGPGFLPWHRAYLLLWEKALQQISGDDDFAIPYWDWSGEPNCSVCTDKYVGGSDASSNYAITGPFSDLRVLCHDFEEWTKRGELCSNNVDPSTLPPVQRNPGGDHRSELQVLPSKEAVDYALSVKSYDNVPEDYYYLNNSWKESQCSFRNLLEGFADSENRTGWYGKNVHQLHNHIHIYLNGTMSSSPLASNDPIFLLHHSNIDRIFEKWLRRYDVSRDDYPSNSTPTGHGRFSYMVPFFPVYTNDEFFQRSEEFGYTYDDIDEAGLSTVEIIGIVVGCVAVAIVVGVIAYLVRRRRHKRNYQNLDNRAET